MLEFYLLMFFGRILNAYNTALNNKPLLITSLSTGFCYGSGDLLAQYIEKKQGKREKFDWHRTSVFTVFGTVAAGPIYYGWFSKINKMPMFLENVIKWNQQRVLTGEFKKQLAQNIKLNKLDTMSMKTFREQFRKNFETIDKPLIRSKTILVSKVYADQFIFSSIYPVFFMIATGMALDLTKEENRDKLSISYVGESFDNSWTNVKNKFAKIYITDCAVWPLIQMANFAFVPAPLQPIFVNTINIGWNAFLSYVSQDGHH